MRILWLSNPPWQGSGYGEQTAIFGKRLAALGHDVAYAANYGLAGSTFEWNGATVYPADGVWGNRTAATYARHHKADLVIALCDAWVLKPDEWPEDIKLAIWAPVDHHPCPPAVYATLSHPKVTPIAMSRHGEAEMTAAGLKPLYVPHGYDPGVFYPDPDRRAEIREQLGIPDDAFLAGMVAANKGNPATPRKGWSPAFYAWSRFAARREDAWLYCHTEAKPSTGGGIDLDRLAVWTRAQRLRFPPDEAWAYGFSSSRVADLYRAFDVLLMPSMGEGFGVPALEAQACGCPVIASNHSAMPEVARVGWLVEGEPWWDELQASEFIVPYIGSIEHALEQAYLARHDDAIKIAAVEHALAYEADRVTAEHWAPTLEVLAEPGRLTGASGLNRAERRRRKRKVAA